MTFGYALQSGFEILGFILLVLALIFEGKIALWEQKMIKRIKRKFTRKGEIISFSAGKNDCRAV